MARRQHLTASLILALVVFFSITFFMTGSSTAGRNVADLSPGAARSAPEKPLKGLDTPHDGASSFAVDLESAGDLFNGDSIAPKMENATLKAELGRATWRFLHTMVARFPEKPTPDDRKTLETFIHLFARLYPCGDCAKHFRGLLAKYPPQTSSRNSAAGWLCFAHNVVNERLHKPVFDCNKIGDFYDCGCGDEGKKDKKKEGEKRDEDALATSEIKAEAL